MGSLTGKENEDPNGNEQGIFPVAPRTFVGDVKIDEGNEDPDHARINCLNDRF